MSDSNPVTTCPALEADSITAGYGGPAAIRDVSLSVNPGELVALLGANGAGKTTTLLAVAGELPLQGGVVRLNGNIVRAPLHRRARQGLAFVPEGRSISKSVTTADNLRVAKVSTPRVLQMFPELASRLAVRGGLLSGGEQQMLAVGRALGRDPSLLLADELSLGLAPKVVTRLLEAVRVAAHEQGAAVLLVEQQVRKVLRYVDRVYVLRRGAVVMELSAVEAQARISEIESTYLSSDAAPPTSGGCG